MKIEFVGGSKDGEVMDIPPEMNHRLRLPVQGSPLTTFLEDTFLGEDAKEASSIFGISCEEYEYKEGRYHFIGYC